MALERSARPLAQCLRCTRHKRIATRSLSATTWRAEALSTEPPTSAEPPPPPPPTGTDASAKERINPETVSNTRRERLLLRNHGQQPVGSRRRRAALASSAKIPFEELPYQCFQEARKVLQADRAEKVVEIEELNAKIVKWSAEKVPPEREAIKEKRLKSWEREVERLKILADANDPLVKKNWEDGFGDMNKPIYRHLANRKWRSHARELLIQRITQMNVVPDVLPAIDPTVSTSLSFKDGRFKVPHGEFVLASTSEKAPKIEIQSYEKAEKLVTIAVVTPDVPNVEKDGFDYRCHFLAVNVPISPTRKTVDMAKLNRTEQVVQDWLPPHSQKGAPYQRLAVVVLEQPSSVPEPAAQVEQPTNGAINADSQGAQQAATSSISNEVSAANSRGPRTPIPERLDTSAIKGDTRYTNHESFILRSFATKYRLHPIGVDLFRSQWDETTADVMRRNAIVGHDVEFQRKRVDPLPYQRLKGERYR